MPDAQSLVPMKMDDSHTVREITRRQFIVKAGKASLLCLAAPSLALLPGCDPSEDLQTMHRNALIQSQETCKPVITQLLGSENVDRFSQAALREYDRFSSKLPVLKGKNNRDQFYASAPFMLAHYRALLSEFSFDRDKALDVLRQMTNFKVRKKFENPGPVMSFIFPRVSRCVILRKLTLARFKYRDEKYGWDAVFPESDAYIAVDMTRCGLADWFRDQGAPEIAPIACEGDFIWTELLTGLKFNRTKTIANGDDICDFRFVKV